MTDQAEMQTDSLESPTSEFGASILNELNSGSLKLPVMPEVVLRIGHLASNPGATIHDLTEIIVEDVTLASQLIKISNSPLYRGRDHIDSVPVAVSRLGFRTVKNLVSSLAVEQTYKGMSNAALHQARRLWRMSADVAARCHALSCDVPGVHKDEAMLAGLIHNIGRLPLIAKFQDSKYIFEDDDVVEELMRYLSVPVGVAVLESWNYSPRLIEVVRHCNDYSRDVSDCADLIDVVQVASLQSSLNVSPAVPPEDFPLVPAFRKLNIDFEMQVEILGEGSHEYDEALALFDR